MSRGPGRIQRAILDAIATPAASESFDTEPLGNHYEHGPVGVPLDAVFGTVYGAHTPTRAQRVAVHRAVRELERRGLIGTYSRRCCPARHEVAEYIPWPERCPDCNWLHLPALVVGRPRTEAEQDGQRQSFARAMTLARTALG